MYLKKKSAGQLIRLEEISLPLSLSLALAMPPKNMTAFRSVLRLIWTSNARNVAHVEEEIRMRAAIKK